MSKNCKHEADSIISVLIEGMQSQNVKVGIKFLDTSIFVLIIGIRINNFNHGRSVKYTNHNFAIDDA